MSTTRSALRHAIPMAALLASITVIAGRNFLLFHSLAEFFSIGVAWTIFLTAIPSRRFTSNDYILFLGFAYLVVGTLDLVHTLSYKGMGVFPNLTANEPTQLWIAARYVEAVALLAAPTFLRRRVPVAGAASVGAILVAVVLVLIFATDAFPDSYVEGVGLTRFKRWSEYVIAAIFGAALWRMFRNRAKTDVRLFHLVVASLILTVIAELAFTAYASVYGPANQLGHLLKLVSFYLIYLGTIHNGLTRPYEVLFADLATQSAALRESNARLTAEVARRAETEHTLETINGRMRVERDRLQARLSTLERDKGTLVQRTAEQALHKAEEAQRAARATGVLSRLEEENEILRRQLSDYVQMFEQAHDGINSLLSGGSED